jgi:hypothetical protein
MLTAIRRLREAADRFRRETEIGLTISGHLYLWRLLLKGASTIAGEGKQHDEEEIARAQAATERLLAAAAGLSATNGPGMEMGLFLAAVGGASSRRISAPDLRLALRQLCPLWPFC